ncbi:MAG: tRNA (adenosine(37)-N6)-threonylcarbamoyltransferase complex dimerization subunit type 1 TsaB [Ignavibacteriae bacterium]|nr:tRNA (adenosine(37)-N6)-threonylcarbamoyltransferase complex dimerization subunit type 1 TsaB [Ignavibacteriota bacterium]
MAKILAIESSGNVCGVCMIEDGLIVFEEEIISGNIHDQMLADIVKRVLEGSGEKTISNMGAVAVSAGPGSFTGIRIGTAIAKALCFGDVPKFIAVPTLKSIANSFLNSEIHTEFENVLTILESVNNTAFIAKYDKNLEEKSDIELIELSNLDSKISNQDLICGNVRNFNEKSNLLNNKFIQIELSAKHIGKLGFGMYNQGIFTNPEEFKPIYAQDFVPVRKIKIPKIKL